MHGLAYLGEGGEIVQTPRRQRITELDKIPLPRWDLVPLKGYLAGGLSFGVNRGRTIPMLATRGLSLSMHLLLQPQYVDHSLESASPRFGS